jgi:ataxin-3
MARLLYHEKQTSMLCGVHALNTLLQGPYFSAHDLAAIATEFDERERALMRESGVESADFLRYMAEDSGNAAADGNFSIQVLTKALEVWNLTCVPATSREAGSAWRSPQDEVAFLCNLDQHWFAVRRRDDVESPSVHAGGGFGGKKGSAPKPGGWWNFNSMFPAPQPISELYLSAFLAQLKEEGYSIFVVRGALPAAADASSSGTYGRWVNVEDAAADNKAADAVKAAGRARCAAEQAMARVGAGGRATLTTLARGGGGGGGGGEGSADDAELQAAIAASLGHGHGHGHGGGAGKRDSAEDAARALAASYAGAGAPSAGGGNDADADLAAAIAASLAQSTPPHSQSPPPPMALPPVPDEPAAGDPAAVTLAVRVPSGRRLSRRFRDVDAVAAVAAFVAAETGVDMSRHALVAAFPRRPLSDLGRTLKDAGVKDKEALSVEPRR